MDRMRTGETPSPTGLPRERYPGNSRLRPRCSPDDWRPTDRDTVPSRRRPRLETPKEDRMARFRRVGLAFVFSVTLAGGVLVAQPAQAFTLPPAQCARLEGAI